MTRSSTPKHCINLRPGKKCRLLLVHTNPVANPKVNAIVDTLNAASLTFGSLKTKWINDLKATVRFKITVAVAAPAPAAPQVGGAAPAPAPASSPPTDGDLTITLVDVDEDGNETDVETETIEVDYIDDPDDP